VEHGAGGVATLTLDRPPVNVLDLAAIAELDDALERIAGLADLRLLVLHSASDKAFSAGVSIDDHTPDKIEPMLTGFHGACLRLRSLPCLTVAVVRGHCLGGGMELALSADFVLAGESARFGQPEITVGCFPPLAAALYPRRLGPGRTLDLLATGRILDAEEAERLGIVTWRVPDGEVDERLARLVADLETKSLPVLQLTKRAVAAGRDLPFGPALAETERLYIEELADLEDLTEGVQAFLDKRPPRWRDR
jgi:cyclohexa-1,5-dienecarbonyl-CoA hydratase